MLSIRDYLYQVFNHPGTTEYALNISFDSFLYCNATPLGHPSKLANENFTVPISFFYGENDWMRSLERETGPKIVHDSQNPSSSFHILKGANHNLHLSNP